MKIFFLAFIAIVGLISCKTFYDSPMVSFNNFSSDGSIIKNIKVIWNGYHLLEGTYPMVVCGGGGGQNFALRNKSDLFGPVHVEWKNAKGEKITKDFIFKKSDLTSYPYYLSHIYLFFTQNDVEYYTSDNPNIKKIEREKSGNWVYKWYEKEGVTKCVNDPKEVVRLRAQKKKYPNISTETGKPIE